jgi:Ferritin-like
VTDAAPLLVVETREELVYLLAQASELEHGVMCEYLFALWSMKRRPDEGLNVEQLAQVARWGRTISRVAMEEMLHLALTTNLLSAVGAAPHFHRPNFPILSRWYPPGVQIALVPFGERALRHFLYLERPDGIELEDAEGFEAAREAQPLRGPDTATLMAGPREYHTVGQLYRSIEHGLERLVDRYGEAGVFVGPATAQATGEVFAWPGLRAVRDLASAKAAIELIIEQGEGARGNWREAHFGRFAAMLDEYLAATRADPGFSPARPTWPAYAGRPPDVADEPVIRDPLTSRVTDLFDAVYETMLQALCRYLVNTEETAAERKTLAAASQQLMTRVMRPLGPLLCTLPLGPDRPGEMAGPAFRIVHPSQYVLPYREAGWRILVQRLTEVADACSRLGREPGLEQVAKLEENVRAIAASLQAHLDTRAGTPGSDR